MTNPTKTHDLPSADHHTGRDEKAAKTSKKLSDKLDEALEESFPGSDPIQISQPAPSAKDKHRT